MMKLRDECLYLARQVLWGQGGGSSDVVETLGEKFLAIAQEHEQHVRENRETDEVIAQAVRYLADTHAIPPMGTDTAWFATAMEVLMSLAVPDSHVTEEAAAVLPRLQEGIEEAIALAPTSREEMRIEDSDASQIATFQEVGCEWGLVSSLLDVVERMYHGDPMTDEERRLIRNAAMSAALTRNARQDAGLNR